MENIREVLKDIVDLKPLERDAELKNIAATFKVKLSTLKEELEKITAENKARPDQGAEAQVEQEPELVKASLPDLPVEEPLVVPRGYQINAGGVYKVRQTEDGTTFDQIANEPIVVTAKSEDIVEGLEMYEVRFKSNGTWKKITDNRTSFVDRRKLVEHADQGLPVTSNNAPDLVEYLDAFVNANKNILKLTKVVSRMGKIELLGGVELFAVGDQLITTGTAIPNIEVTASSPGEKQVQRAFTQHGDIQAWLSMLGTLVRFPKVMFAVYCALVPALMAFVNLLNFIVEFVGDSSRGKTTAMEIAASVWGFPLQDRQGLIHSWNMTPVAVERLASFSNHLPVFLDDLQTANSFTIEGITYMLSNGRGKGRGKPEGTRPTPSWKSVVFSTGEKSICGPASYDGISARVISIWGSPFGDEHQAQLVNEVKLVVANHYGHAGIIFVKHLLTIDKAVLQVRYNDYLQYYLRLARGPLSSRMCSSFAAIRLAADIFNEIFGLDPQVAKAVDVVYLDTTKHLDLDNLADRVREDLFGWATKQGSNFIGGPNRSQYNQNIMGIWSIGEPRPYIAIISTECRAALKELGYDPNAAMKSLHTAGLIKGDGDRLDRKEELGNNNRVRCICLLWPVKVKPAETELIIPPQAGAELGRS